MALFDIAKRIPSYVGEIFTPSAQKAAIKSDLKTIIALPITAPIALATRAVKIGVGSMGVAASAIAVPFKEIGSSVASGAGQSWGKVKAHPVIAGGVAAAAALALGGSYLSKREERATEQDFMQQMAQIQAQQAQQARVTYLNNPAITAADMQTMEAKLAAKRDGGAVAGLANRSSAADGAAVQTEL